MTAEEFEQITGVPLDLFAHDCHRAALTLVKTLGRGRVARGWAEGVGSQHSWMVDGDDCYDPHARVLDPTLWSYDDSVKGVWEGFADDAEHPYLPHGTGSIWEYGKPTHQGGATVTLSYAGLSPDAMDFLELLGPLDYRGWAQLAHAPVGGWPAAEIIGVMYDDERLSALIPIDIVGMVTYCNPHGLYLPSGDTT